MIDTQEQTMEAYAIAPIIEQIHEAAAVLGSTFGPEGKLVIIQGPTPFFTRDGHTVLQYMPKDKPGFRLLADACATTVAKAGDGTTSTALLASALIRYCSVIGDHQSILDYLQASVLQPDHAELIRIATNASHDDKLGKLIGDLIYELGEDAYIRGVVGEETSSDITTGYQCDSGPLVPDFLNISPQQASAWPFLMRTKRGGIVLREPYIILINDRIEDHKVLVKIFQDFNELTAFKAPLVFFLPDMNTEALRNIVTNFTERNLPIFLITAPGDGMQRYDMLSDIAYATGADLYGKHTKGLSRFAGCYGRAESIELDKQTCRIVTNTDLKARIAELKAGLIDDEKRLGNLSGKIGTLTIGRALQATIQDKSLNVEDAINATKSALRLGYLLGGRRLWEDLADAFPMYGEAFGDLANRLPTTGEPLDATLTVMEVIRNAFDLASKINQSGYTILSGAGARPMPHQ